MHHVGGPTVLNGFLWTKECGDEKLVVQAGVVKERVAEVVMGKMSVTGDGKNAVGKLHVGPGLGRAKYCASAKARFKFHCNRGRDNEVLKSAATPGADGVEGEAKWVRSVLTEL